MPKTIWITPTNHLVIVSKVDVDLYYYEYGFNEFIQLEKSPNQFKLEYIGNL